MGRTRCRRPGNSPIRSRRENQCCDIQRKPNFGHTRFCFNYLLYLIFPTGSNRLKQSRPPASSPPHGFPDFKHPHISVSSLKPAEPMRGFCRSRVACLKRITDSLENQKTARAIGSLSRLTGVNFSLALALIFYRNCYPRVQADWRIIPASARRVIP